MDCDYLLILRYDNRCANDGFFAREDRDGRLCFVFWGMGWDFSGIFVRFEGWKEMAFGYLGIVACFDVDI